MTMLKFLYLNLTAYIAISGAASAQDISTFTPREQIQIPVRSIPGQAIDIVGFTTGMPLKTAEDVLNERVKGKEFRKEIRTLGGTVNGFSVKTDPFIQRFIYEDDAQLPVRENIVAAFSSPASGSKLISLQRMIVYRSADVSPTLEDVKKSIVEKYGQPASISDNTVTLTFNYPYRNGTPTKCITLGKGSESCAGFSNQAYQPERLNAELSETKAGDDFLLSVSIWRLYNSDRVSSVTSEMSDFTARVSAYKADNIAIQNQAKLLQASKPAPSAPKL